MDKAGHAFGAYIESYSAYKALRWAGMDKKRALIYGGPIGLIFQTPIEIFDGLYEGWGFSWSDMAANTFGSLLFTTQEAIFDEQLILMKFSYSPSKYPSHHSALGESHLESFFLDYNAQTYWLSGNLRGITGSKKIPSWINIAFGYSANGMIHEFDNPQYYQGKPFPHLERYRQYLFSLDIDFSKITTKRKWVKNIYQAINLIKIPFPAIEVNKMDGVRLRPIYF
ncbi:MAG: YfiM family protein [Bacteroidales bacterium]|nr:YfiM family protein [Bacteroidales bacterium]MCF8458394.1 YfiM family protein [Bacteroidales bacterium]